MAESIYTDSFAYQVEVTEEGYVQVRRALRVFKNGIEISKSYHRHILEPGADTVNECDKVKAISGAAWTSEVIATHEAKKANKNIGND